VASIEKQIAAESARLEKVVEQYNKARIQLAATKASATALAARMRPVKAELARSDQRIQEIISFAYKGGDLSEVSAVLASADPAMVIERLITLDQISRVEQENLAAHLATKASHDAQAAELERLIKDQTAKTDALAAQKKKIDSDLSRLYALRRQAYGSATVTRTTTTASPASAPYVAGRAGIAVKYAYGALGKPYVWGASGPGGYDCSGLTMAAWRAAGVGLPHNAAMQWQTVPHISRSALRPGDLVFYSGLGHVAIYVGSGKVIHSPTFGDVVHVSSVDMMPPYGYGRPG
jgi:cell wall-associated NlpC family hydrolase